MPTLRDGHDLIDGLPGAMDCPQPVTQALANARVPSTEPVAPTARHRSLVGLLRSNTSLRPKRRHEPRTQWDFGQAPSEANRPTSEPKPAAKRTQWDFGQAHRAKPIAAKRTQWDFGQARQAKPIEPNSSRMASDRPVLASTDQPLRRRGPGKRPPHSMPESVGAPDGQLRLKPRRATCGRGRSRRTTSRACASRG